MNCQSHRYLGQDPRAVSRRWFFHQCGVGLGGIALGRLLEENGLARTAAPDPLAPKQPHHAARAKRVIYLFMAGAPSHLELFDNKPALAKFDGTLPPAEMLKGYRAAFINPQSKLLGPKFRFARHGQCGAEVSELLPHLAGVVDDIAIVRGMVTDAFNHAPGQIEMNTGAQIFGRPSFGAWTLYGLGSETKDLPGYVVFSTGSKGPSGGNSNWGPGFLPTVYSGVQFRAGGEPVLTSNPPGVDGEMQSDTIATLNRMNRMRLDTVGDPEIATRVSAFEMAFRMQSSAPEAMDLGRESAATLEMYGAEPGRSSFANCCLLARRLVERGVRFVQIFHEAWDQHGNLVNDLKKNCRDTDRASAALIRDLKQRGLLDDTLVIWGEFGRTPMVQGGSDGRDHHPNAFTLWLAGGGVKPGITLGESDELGFNVVRDRVHVHDLHATLLHLLGFDHERLTYRFQGRDFRLTDVHGEVVRSPARVKARGVWVIAGSDTGVGKTVLTACLARWLRARFPDARVRAVKPLCSGGREDARRLRAASGHRWTLDQTNPWWFRRPLSPRLAARAEGVAVHWREVRAFLRDARASADGLLVEGAGGLLSPLGEDFDTRDWVRGLDAVPVLVVPDRLGALNQVLLAVEALGSGGARARVALVDIGVRGTVSRTNREWLRERLGPERVLLVPRFRDPANPDWPRSRSEELERWLYGDPDRPV